MCFIINTKGIVRKIDSLGRIVIPKEIRSLLNINTGDDIEMFINSNNIVLKKYSYAKTFLEYVNSLIKIMPIQDNCILFTDREKVISEGIYKDCKINDHLFYLLDNNIIYTSSSLESICIGDIKLNCYYIVEPILYDYKVIGLIILISNRPIKKEDGTLIKCFKALIENKINLC